jgi:hypothetical protein
MGVTTCMSLTGGAQPRLVHDQAIARLEIRHREGGEKI